MENQNAVLRLGEDTEVIYSWFSHLDCDQGCADKCLTTVWWFCSVTIPTVGDFSC